MKGKAEIPKSVQRRISVMGIAFVFGIFWSIVTIFRTHNVIQTLVNLAMCAGIGYLISIQLSALKNNQMTAFEGICIGIQWTGLTKSGRKYLLQGADRAIEVESSSTLHLHKGTKYRFYIPSDLLTEDNKGTPVRVQQFFGFENIGVNNEKETEKKK